LGLQLATGVHVLLRKKRHHYDERVKVGQRIQTQAQPASVEFGQEFTQGRVNFYPTGKKHRSPPLVLSFLPICCVLQCIPLPTCRCSQMLGCSISVQGARNGP